jgi:hypothetical protein
LFLDDLNLRQANPLFQGQVLFFGATTLPLVHPASNRLVVVTLLQTLC